MTLREYDVSQIQFGIVMLYCPLLESEGAERDACEAILPLLCPAGSNFNRRVAARRAHALTQVASK